MEYYPLRFAMGWLTVGRWACSMIPMEKTGGLAFWTVRLPGRNEAGTLALACEGLGVMLMAHGPHMVVVLQSPCHDAPMLTTMASSPTCSECLNPTPYPRGKAWFAWHPSPEQSSTAFLDSWLEVRVDPMLALLASEEFFGLLRKPGRIARIVKTLSEPAGVAPRR